MKEKRKDTSTGLTRRQSLKLGGLALGGFGLAASGLGRARADCTEVAPCYPTDAPTDRYSLFGTLDEFTPGTPLGEGEMRIIFLGSTIPPPRYRQQMMSVFVEVGPHVDAQGKAYDADQAVFDCGSGVMANYGAMGINLGRMDKVFINHLHGDHMNDLTHIYCFGPSMHRMSPLFVFGPGPSGVKSPMPPRRLYDDGTNAYCRNLRDACRWHTESFSFQPTSYSTYERPTRQSWGLPCEPVPVSDDSPDDSYAMIPIELDWRKVGVAYNNVKTGMKVTHFPVIHCRKGSVGYKVEWNGLSMIYTSDTRPESTSIALANGIDVFVHEIALPPELWAMKTLGLSHVPAPDEPIYPTFQHVVELATTIQNSSHTPQGAFGYLVSQIEPKPRLTVATHFTVADDTNECAWNSIHTQCPQLQPLDKFPVYAGPDTPPYFTFSADLMVVKVTKNEIKQMQGKVPDLGWPAAQQDPWVGKENPPKYWKWGVDANGDPVKVSDPEAQLELSTFIPPGDATYCDSGY